MPEFVEIAVTAEDGSSVTLGVPADWDPADPFGPYSAELVRTAFDRVEDPRDWKAPVDRTLHGVSKEERDLISFAVSFYTATDAVWTEPTPGVWHVSAVGYRMGPAGP